MSIFKSSRNTTNFTQFNTSDDELLQHFNSFNWKLKFILKQSKVQIRNTQVFQLFFFKPSPLYFHLVFFVEKKQIFQTINQRVRTFPSGRNEQLNVFYPHLWLAHIVHVWDLPPWAPRCWASLLSS